MVASTDAAAPSQGPVHEPKSPRTGHRNAREPTSGQALHPPVPAQQHTRQRRRSSGRFADTAAPGHEEAELLTSHTSVAFDMREDSGSAFSQAAFELHPPRQPAVDPSSPTLALMYRVAKDVANVFSPTLQYDTDRRRRSSAVSAAGGGSPLHSVPAYTAVPPIDPAHYTINYATSNPNFPLLSVLPPAASLRLHHTPSPRSGSHRNVRLKAAAGSFENSFLSGSISSDEFEGDGADGDGTTQRSPRGTGATTVTGAFFDPFDPDDPFEKEAFTVETRRAYQAEKQRDERLDAMLASMRQLLMRRQTELARPQDKRTYGNNIRFVTASGMWATLFAFVRFVQRARDAYTDEMFAQRVVKQMAPLCAIRLRQRLKRTRIVSVLPTITRPTLEVFKADRTFSHFPEDQLEGIRIRMELVFFFRNEAILYSGVQDDQCYIVERGIAETRDGLTVLNVFRKNHIVGALGMMVGEPRIHSVVASTELYAWVIRRKDFDATLNLNDAKTKNALAVVNELRQKNIRDVYHDQLQPDALRQFLLFSGIRDTVLESIVADSTPRVFKRGDAILRAGDTATHALCVIRGRVRLSVVPQLPLSTSKSIQLHVAETVCLQQHHHRRPVGGAGAKKPNASLLVVRDDHPPPGSPSPSLQGGKSLVCGVDEHFLDSTMSIAAHSMGSYGAIDGGHAMPGYHANGMACEIACPVLISVPSAMEGGDTVHRFLVSVLSESVDCLVISAEKLRNALHIDRETRLVFAYNLTCLALPFIQPLPKAQLLRTLFPKCFAFAFLPKLPLHTLEQIPVVFAANDVIVMDDADGEEACAVIVYKGQLQPWGGLYGANNCLDTMAGGTMAGQHQHEPFLWPEISFVCVPGAKAKARAVSPIEGVLIKRKHIIDLVHNSLRGSERTVLLDALKAHYTARVGRPILGGGGHGVVPSVPSRCADGGAQTQTQSTAMANSGNQRIRMALYGTLEQKEVEAVFHANKGGRVNPLIRGEVNAVNLPKHPDRSKSLDALVAAKHHQLQRQQTINNNNPDSPATGSPTARSPTGVGGAPSSFSEWLSQASEAVGCPPDGSGCIQHAGQHRDRSPPPVIAPPRAPGIATIVKATRRPLMAGREQRQQPSSPSPPPTARSLLASDFLHERATPVPGAPTAPVPEAPLVASHDGLDGASHFWVSDAIRRPLQQSFFIVREVMPIEPPQGSASAGAPRGSDPGWALSVSRNRLPQATSRRRQVELMEKCEALRAAATMSSRQSAIPVDALQPTSASTRMIMAAHQRRATAALMKLSTSGTTRTQ